VEQGVLSLATVGPVAGPAMKHGRLPGAAEGETQLPGEGSLLSFGLWLTLAVSGPATRSLLRRLWLVLGRVALRGS